MNEKKTDQERRAELNGKGCEQFTNSACFQYIGWRKGPLPPEPSPPREPPDPLRDGLEKAYDILHRGTR